MFQLKDFVSIAASMINRARATQTKITDFNVGSVARTLMESPAIEIEELYQRMFAGIMDAIPVAIYRGFDFATLDPAKASGIVTVTFGGPIAEEFTVPAGTIFLALDTGLRYLSVSPVTAEVGASSISIVVNAADVGSVYNADANAITVASGFTLPIGSVISSNPITSGSDGETELERASRFIAYIRSISRGTVAAVEYGAASAKVLDESGAVVEYVSRVGSSEVPGRIDVFIYGSGAVASPALLSAAQEIVDGYFDSETGRYVPGYRSAGVDALVLPMVEVPRNVNVIVDLATGYTLTTAMRDAVVTAIANEMDGVGAGETLYVDNLKAAALSVEGVMRVRLDTSENYLCPPNVVIIPGVISVVEGGV